MRRHPEGRKRARAFSVGVPGPRGFRGLGWSSACS